MRTDQYMGLSPRARAELARFCEEAVVHTIIHFQDGRKQEHQKVQVVPSYQVETIGSIAGTWNDHVANLSRYIFLDGRVWEEFVQAIPWSSGPCYFISVTQDGDRLPRLDWNDEEIAAA